MLGTYFYHQIIRKTVVSFGTIFNQIYIKHQGDDGVTISDMRVPNISNYQKDLILKNLQVDLLFPQSHHFEHRGHKCHLYRKKK